jgi:hypothetical protein
MIKREEREREGDRLDVSFCEIWSKLKTNFKLQTCQQSATANLLRHFSPAKN